MGKQVLLTGASGFVGRTLGAALAARGDSVIAVSRGGDLPFTMVSWEKLSTVGEADAVVHLAGESVAQRWTAEAKKRIVSSRVETLGRLAAVRAPVLVSASAIGYYGDRGDEWLEESSPPGSDFLAGVCAEWEKAARALPASRTAILRLGMVLGQGGGALAKMIPPFRLGAGGRIGDGRQWVSWIQAEDLVQIFLRAIDDPAWQGVYNAVAPEPVRNAELADALAATLGTKARLPAPAFALRLALGEMAEMLLASQRVSAKRLLTSGFTFRYSKVFEALRASVAE